MGEEQAEESKNGVYTIFKIEGQNGQELTEAIHSYWLGQIEAAGFKRQDHFIDPGDYSLTLFVSLDIPKEAIENIDTFVETIKDSLEEGQDNYRKIKYEKFNDLEQAQKKFDEYNKNLIERERARVSGESIRVFESGVITENDKEIQQTEQQGNGYSSNGGSTSVILKFYRQGNVLAPDQKSAIIPLIRGIIKDDPELEEIDVELPKEYGSVLISVNYKPDKGQTIHNKIQFIRESDAFGLIPHSDTILIKHKPYSNQ